MKYSTAELMAVYLSRQIKDGEVIGGGGGSQLVPRAAQLLAHLHHGPNMKLHLFVRTNLYEEASVSLSVFESICDWRQNRFAEAYWTPSEIFDDMRLFTKRVFFIGGVQIDKFGNINLFGVGNDSDKMDFRGPGGFGAATASTYVNRYYIYTGTHSKRIFVEQCDYITCLGWGFGGSDARAKLGLPGGGPAACVTPLCVMDFTEDTKAMRLKSVHPGVDVSKVVENTGFNLVIPGDVPETEPPTKEELAILRRRIDPEGLLHRTR